MVSEENENWSDDEIETEVKHKVKQDDLVFLLFCAFIFEKRTRSGVPSVDKRLGELSAWLTHSDKLRLSADSCEASTLDFDDADTPRIVDALNTYSPEFPLNLIFSENSGSYIAKRINVRSPSTYKYKLTSGGLDLPFFHGGRIEIEGDVLFDSVVDLLSSVSTLAFTTEIDVSGSLVGCNPESVKLGMKHLRQVIFDHSDEELFQFSVSGGVNFENDADSVVDSVVVRKWTISFSSTSDSRWCLKCNSK